MLTARTAEGNKVFARDMSKEIPFDYSCPECLKRVLLRYGTIRITRHFYHDPKTRDLGFVHKGEPETPFHVAMKAAIRDQFQLTANEVEESLGNARCDILTHRYSFFEWIEVQRSSISIEEVRDRERNAREQGVFLKWVLGIPYGERAHHGKSQVTKEPFLSYCGNVRQIAKLNAVESYLIDEKRVHYIPYCQELEDGSLRWFKRHFVYRCSKLRWLFRDVASPLESLFLPDGFLIRFIGLELHKHHSLQFLHILPLFESVQMILKEIRKMRLDALERIEARIRLDKINEEMRQRNREATAAAVAKQAQNPLVREVRVVTRDLEPCDFQEVEDRSAYSKHLADAYMILRRRIATGKYEGDNHTQEVWKIAKTISESPDVYHFEILASRSFRG